MKKISTLTVFVALAALMALSVATPVNNSPGKAVMQGITIQADGSPLHPPHGIPTLLADGSPMPPLPPHFAEGEAAVAADGSPIPPMPPHLLAGSIA